MENYHMEVQPGKRMVCDKAGQLYQRSEFTMDITARPMIIAVRMSSIGMGAFPMMHQMPFMIFSIFTVKWNGQKNAMISVPPGRSNVPFQADCRSRD